METTENKFSWLKNSISLKISVIGFIILLMLIPANLIKDLMRERQNRLRETFREVTSKWGETQKIGGLIITVPCIETIKKDEKKIFQKKYLHILPDQLNVTGEVIPEHLHRGIFDVLVYRTQLNFNGWFDSISLPNTNYRDCDILWDKAIVTIGISDTRGINKNISIKWNNKNLITIPGTADCLIMDRGVHATLNIDPKQKYSFSFELDINGSGLLSFLPLGKETNINLSSKWPHPQFDGAYLPDKREITNNGFSANWKILEHNRDYPQQWFGQKKLDHSAFGVELIKQVDIYQKSMRAVKYALLFIILTFLVFFFAEIIINKKAHPVQYIMVGAALCIFFSLLIALSEHIHFNIAYIIASITIIAMVTLFSKSVFKNLNVTGVVFLVMVVLFTFLFVILQLADYSLILGNIGLVIVLAIIMYVSRKIDWYNEKTKQNDIR